LHYNPVAEISAKVPTETEVSIIKEYTMHSFWAKNKQNVYPSIHILATRLILIGLDIPNV
jgi:hypothetical protein